MKEEIEIIELKKEMDEVGEKNMSKEKKARYVVLRKKQKADRRQIQEIILKEQSKSFNKSQKSLWWLWLIPIGIIVSIILSVLFVPAEKYDPSYDPRIENCGPGGTWC